MPYADILDQIFDLTDTQGTQLLSSTVTLAETLVKSFRLGDTKAKAVYRDLLQYSGTVSLSPVSESIAVRAAQLRATYKFKTPDALHLATALESGCNAFLTNDADLKKAAGLRVLVLSELTLTPP